MTPFDLHKLEAIIADRAAGGDDTSWTAKLVGKGLNKVAEKLGEEAVETVIAAIAEDADKTRDEAADLVYHLLVLLHVKGVSVSDLMAELERRTGQSGLAEKASRSG